MKNNVNISYLITNENVKCVYIIIIIIIINLTQVLVVSMWKTKDIFDWISLVCSYYSLQNNHSIK
jgi:hypothetical protein